jgi:hypothetical protein
MGAYANMISEAEIAAAKVGQLVAAGAGYFLLNPRFPDEDPQSVLAWRVAESESST